MISETRQLRWVGVASVAIISFVIGGVGSVAVGLFITPWMREFGWPNVRTSSIATAFGLTAFLAAPAVGAALDRIGPRRVMSIGALAVSTGFVAIRYCHTHGGILGGFILIGFGYCASFYIPSAVVVTDLMKSQKSLAMGIIFATNALGAMFFSVLIAWLLETAGWRFACEVIAALVALIVPLILFSIPVGPPQHRDRTELLASRSTTPALRKSFLSPTFLTTVVSSALFAVGSGGIYYHVVSLLVKAGYSASFAGFVFGSSWLVTGFGSLLLGVLANRFGVKQTLCVALLCSAGGTLCLLGAKVTPLGLASVVGFTILWGAPANSIYQFVPVIFAEHFGINVLGVLIGVQAAIMGVAGALAPMATGVSLDEFGDYRVAIWMSAFALCAACTAVLPINLNSTSTATRKA